MAIEVHNVSKDWTFEQIVARRDEILALFDKLAARMPLDITRETLIEDTEKGRKALWLILKDDAVVAFAMTFLKVVDATGYKIATLCDLAGEGYEDWMDPLNTALEQWADELGADCYQIECRHGWERLLRRFGYRPFTVMLRKEAHGQQ